MKIKTLLIALLAPMSLFGATNLFDDVRITKSLTSQGAATFVNQTTTGTNTVNQLKSIGVGGGLVVDSTGALSLNFQNRILSGPWTATNLTVSGTSTFANLNVSNTLTFGTGSTLGYLGVGTASPTSQLHVVGTNNTSTAFFGVNGTTATIEYTVFRAGAGNGTTTPILSFQNSASVQKAYVRGDGMVAGTFIQGIDNSSISIVDSSVATAGYPKGLNLNGTSVIGWGGASWFDNKTVGLSPLSSGSSILAVGNGTAGNTSGGVVSRGRGIVVGSQTVTNSLIQAVSGSYIGAPLAVTFGIAFAQAPAVTITRTEATGTALANDVPWVTNITTTGCVVGFRDSFGNTSVSSSTFNGLAFGVQ